jgi:hypothetical protein
MLTVQILPYWGSIADEMARYEACINPEIVSESPEGQLGGRSREGGKRSSDLA